MNTKHVVAKVGELSNGQMKQVEVGDRKILVVCMEGQYKAYPAECPHHGAPLAEGVLRDGHIRCPWHQAMFDAANGELIEPPSLDALTPLETMVVDENVMVLLPKEIPAGREPRMSGEDQKQDVRDASKQGSYVAGGPVDESLRQGRTFVIVGTGAAGSAAAEALRQEGFRGNITMVTAEDHLPYDRTELSKRFLAKPDVERPFLRTGKFYDAHDIDVLYGTKVVELDAKDHRIHFDGGSTLDYDGVLIATGTSPRKLNVPGAELRNVMTLRSLSDAEQIIEQAGSARRAVVVGGSFIGMEVAASLTQRGLEVEVVETQPMPFASSLGERIGRLIQTVHEDESTRIHLNTKVERIEGQARVQAVVLEGGERLEADLVVVGIGVEPVTGFAKGIEKTDDGGILVDAQLRCGDDCWAAGDIARVPDWRNGEPMRIEHWRYAQQTGRLAARNMIGRGESYTGVPFFWTKQHGLILQYVGYCDRWDEIETEGSLPDQDFIAHFLRGGEALAVAGCGRDHQMGLISEAMRGREAMNPSDLQQASGAKVQA